MKRKTIKANTRILKPKIFLNIISKFVLTSVGKKDGKKNIPFLNASTAAPHEIFTPTILREQSRIEKCMALILERINRKNDILYKDTIRRIVHFRQSSIEYQRLYEKLKNKLQLDDIIVVPIPSLNPDVEVMLSSKRRSEDNADDMGIRLRRANEYHQKLRSSRICLIKSRNSLEEQYKCILVNIKQIELIDSYIDSSFMFYNAVINKRLSWYWQGLLLKHPLLNKKEHCIKQIKADNYLVLLEKRRNDVLSQLDELKSIHETVLNMPEL